MRAGAVSLLAAIMLGGSGCVAAPQVTVFPPISQTGSVSTCPDTLTTSSNAPLAFPSGTGSSVVDPATTQVLVCRYTSSVASRVEAWTLDGKGVLLGERARTLASEVNGARPANLMTRCPSSTREELWFFESGTTVMAEFWVQLDGCGFANDGTHSLAWSTGDPLTS